MNGNVHGQTFCDVTIAPTQPLANYKPLDGIMLELAGKLKIQQLQNMLAEKCKPYMRDLDTMYTDVHTANVVQLADRMERRAKSASA